MTKKRLRFGCAALLTLSVIRIASWWITLPFLSRFESPTSLQTYTLSMLTLNETTLQDVEDLINDQAFGTLDCHFYNNDSLVPSPTGNRLLCMGKRDHIGWLVYHFDFHFEGEILRSVEVTNGWRGF